MLRCIFCLTAVFGISGAAFCDANSVKTEPNRVDQVLCKLNEKSKTIKTYQAKVKYLSQEPISTAIRTGTLYFKEDGKSAMRVTFDTVKYDDEPVTKVRQDYIFDGINVTRLDYELENVEITQLAEPNDPLDAFELASQYWPIIGFANVGDLKKDFAISLVKETGDNVQLRLKTRADSKYAQDYTSIDFWIDTKKWQPLRMVSQSPDGIVFDFMLTDAQVNKKIDDDVFNIKIPANFSKNVIPLEK